MNKQSYIRESITSYQKEQKEKNIHRILEIIHIHGQISRINIAKKLHIDRSTVTNIVPELLKFGIIQEVEGKPTGKGGRPPSPLSINPRFGYTLGISIHLKGFHAAILDLDGNLIEDVEGKLPYEPSFFTKNCISILDNLVERLVKNKAPIIGAVIAISGIINPQNNVIDKSFVFRLMDYDFQKEISDKFPFSVLIENDANACAWGELFPHSPSMCTSFLYLLASTTDYNFDDKSDNGMAIGIGVVAEGNMIYGAHNCAGELKSALWEDTDSVENPVSIPPTRLSDIQKDSLVFEEYINEIFISLGPVVSVLDPEAIIIGGDLKDKLSTIQKQLSSPNSKYYLGREQSKYKICSPSKGDNEISAGAACMFLIRLFKQDSKYAQVRCPTRWKNIFAIKNLLS